MDESSTYEALKQRVSQLEKQNELLQSEVTKYRTLLDSLPHGISVSDAALRESEEKYRKLYEDAAIGIFHSSFEGRFLDVNPALAKMLGYETPDEVVDSIYNIAEQIYAQPGDRDEVLEELLSKGETIKTENRYLRKD